MDEMIAAIVEDDASAAKRLLRADAGLAKRIIPGPKLYKSGIFHFRCLLDHGADFHLQDLNGATPLHRAVRTRCVAAVRCFLKAGADPTVRNKPGSTPFHLAVQNTGRGGTGAAAAVSAQREIIQEFLSFGLSPNLKCGRGRTVMDCARSVWIRQLLAGSLAEPGAPPK